MTRANYVRNKRRGELRRKNSIPHEMVTASLYPGVHQKYSPKLNQMTPNSQIITTVTGKRKDLISSVQADSA
jgi:hypothetical protein